MKRFAKSLLLALLIPKLVVVPCWAQLPDVDRPRYAIILKDLKGMSDQLKIWGGWVGAVRNQIQTVEAISNGIRRLNEVASGGLRGVITDVADSVGVTNALMVLGETQSLYNSSAQLIRDIQALPDEAKQQLANIGMATEDVKQFLRDGVMYDTFYSLGGPAWKEVAKNPMRSLETGSFGVALSRADSYLSPEARGQQWRDYLDSLNPGEKGAFAGLLGPQYAVHLADQWFAEMDQRAQGVVDLKAATNKVQARIAQNNATNNEKSVQEALAGANVTEGLKLKILTKDMLDHNKAAYVIYAAEKERTRLLNEQYKREVAEQNAINTIESDTKR